MRRIATAVVLLLGLGGAVVVAASPASAASSTPGAYVPLDPAYRALTKGVQHGTSTTVSLAGHVPSTASAVLVSLSSVGATSGGSLTAYAAGTSVPFVTDVLYAGKVTTTNTVVVALGTGSDAGAFAVRNGAAAGATTVVADVRGYYVGGTVSSDQNLAGGLLHTVVPTRLLDTKTSTPAGVPAGGTVSVSVDPSQAGREYVLISVLGATSVGSIASYAGPPGSSATQPAYGDVYFPGRTSVTGTAIVPTDSAGRFTLINRGSSAARIVVDRVGWAVGGGAATSYGSQVSVGQRVVSAQPVAAGKVASFALLGKAGVPLASVSSVIVRIIVGSPTASGGIDAGAYGASSNALRTLSFTTGQTISTTTVVPLKSGRIDIRNSSGGSLKIYLDVLGFVPTSSHPLPSHVDVGRYPNDLTGTVSSDEAVMYGHGQDDAKARATFVLLDIGAQTVSSPLSTSNPGVSLTQVGSRVPISYGDLVEDVLSYLDGYRSVEGAPAVTVAVGTNNDGVWNPKLANYYAPATRGADWANKVILPITMHAPTGVSVWGADDIEADFQSKTTVTQVNDWETAYLNALTAAKNTTPLLFNGSADGCPSYFGSTAVCNDGWTQAQIASLAYRGGRVEVLPQIYVRQQAVQWANLFHVSGNKLHFLGSLTESADAETYLPDQGWVALYRALTSVVTAPSVPRAVDIAKDVD